MNEPEDDVVAYTRPCERCGGRGRCKEFSGPLGELATCPDCGGTGKITSDATLDQIADCRTDGQARRLVMSQENAARFVTLAQIGISHGLWHPIEWFVNWMKLLPGLTPPEKLEEKTKLAEDVFIGFFRNTGENPGDGSPIESLDREGLYRMVNDFADEKGLP